MELTYSRASKWQYAITSLGILSGLILSIVSYLNLCSEECRAGHDYTLFSLPFGPVGIIFFSGLLIAQLFSLNNNTLKLIVSSFLAAALGAEVVLIFIQKYEIGHWCPVCLGIAASVLVASLPLLYQYFKDLRYSSKGDNMRHLKTGLSKALIFSASLALFFVGVVKENKLEAMENSVKEQIAFGNANSTVNLYLFTDWACPACRALEPNLAKLMPAITSKARMTFVDIPVHPETLNFSPFNLSFMINNKSKYLELREALTTLSTKTSTPTDVQITKLAKEHGATFKELNYADVALGINYWKELATKFEIEATPTLVIVNPTTKKGKKLAGVEEITEENVLKAINALK